MRVGCLVDTTRCIGCRSCRVACKQANGLPGEPPPKSGPENGQPGTSRFSPRTFTFIGSYELEGPGGQPAWVFAKHQCMHCTELYCANVCPADVYHRTDSGVVSYQADNCVGCGACVDACPFHVPALEYWDLPIPQIRKCGFCLGRQEADVGQARLNGKPLESDSLTRYRWAVHTPACARECPSGAIQFGPRDTLIEAARRRIAAAPGKYVDHIYGETEAGGTGWLYLAAVPMEKLGLPTLLEAVPRPAEGPRLGAARPARHRLAAVRGGLAAVVGAAGWLFARRDAVRASEKVD